MEQDLRIIILSPPHISLTHEQGQFYFSQMCNMKIQGYRHIHGSYALPLDHYDYISDHILIGLKKKSDVNYRIISGYRSLSFNYCQNQKIEFDVLKTIRESGNLKCLEEVKNIITKCKENNIDISHDSRWTILPEFNDNVRLKHKCFQLVLTSLFYYHQTKNIKNEWFAMGVNSLNTDKIFYKSGGVNVGKNPYFYLTMPYGKKQKMTLIHAAFNRNESEIAKIAEENKKIWENRLIID